MKTQKFLSTLLIVAFALAPQLLNTSPGALAASGGEAWIGCLLWAASQDRVDGSVSRYEKPARLRDGNLVVAGWGQNVGDVHHTDNHSENEIL
jgi:hypothetical protein